MNKAHSHLGWILLVFILVGAPIFLFASPRDELPSTVIQGIAEIRWEHKGRTYRFDQAISINHNNATLETLDDFGNTLLRMELLEKKIFLTRIIKIPINKSDFLAVLLNNPTHFKNQKFKVSVSDFKKVFGKNYPYLIQIKSKKALLTIHWKQIDHFK